VDFVPGVGTVGDAVAKFIECVFEFQEVGIAGQDLLEVMQECYGVAGDEAWKAMLEEARISRVTKEQVAKLLDRRLTVLDRLIIP
jgi:hypothetical protein